VSALVIPRLGQCGNLVKLTNAIKSCYCNTETKLMNSDKHTIVHMALFMCRLNVIQKSQRIGQIVLGDIASQALSFPFATAHVLYNYDRTLPNGLTAFVYRCCQAGITVDGRKHFW